MKNCPIRSVERRSCVHILLSLTVSVSFNNQHSQATTIHPLRCEMREGTIQVAGLTALLFGLSATEAFTVSSPTFPMSRIGLSTNSLVYSAPVDTIETNTENEQPSDAVIYIKPNAMKRLRELKEKEKKESLVLRMGVRNGGCSGLSYVMDFSKEEDIQEDDAVDEYPADSIKCVVDAKSMLYLYGLELDYSEELIGGGFKFFNPNAEEACGCGSSFGV